MTMMTAREFNRDVSAAKREASRGPVVITDRGEPPTYCCPLTSTAVSVSEAGRWSIA